MDVDEVAGSLRCENGSRSQGSLSICSESKLQKSSILKPSKARAPLQDLNFYCDEVEDEEGFEAMRKRRVSFHHVNNIKEYCPSSETLKICNTAAYEETLSSESSNFSRSSSRTTIMAASMETTNIHSPAANRFHTDDLMDISDLSINLEESKALSAQLNASLLNDSVARGPDDSFSEGISQLLEEASKKSFMKKNYNAADSVLDMSMTCFDIGKKSEDENQAAASVFSQRKSLAMDLTDLSQIDRSNEGEDENEAAISVFSQRKSLAMDISDLSQIDRGLESEGGNLAGASVGPERKSLAVDITDLSQTSLDTARIDRVINEAPFSETELTGVHGKSVSPPLAESKAKPPEKALSINIQPEEKSVAVPDTVFDMSFTSVIKSCSFQKNDHLDSGGYPAFFRDSTSSEIIENPARRVVPETLPSAPESSHNWFNSIESQRGAFSQSNADMSITKVLPLKEIVNHINDDNPSHRFGFIGISERKSTLENTSKAPVGEVSLASSVPVDEPSVIQNVSLAGSPRATNDAIDDAEQSKVPVLEFDASVAVNDGANSPRQPSLDLSLSQIQDIRVDMSVSMISSEIPMADASVLKKIELESVVNETVLPDETSPKLENSSVLTRRLDSTDIPAAVTLPLPALTESSEDCNLVGTSLVAPDAGCGISTRRVSVESNPPDMDCSGMEVDEEVSEIIPAKSYQTSVIMNQVGNISQLIPSVQSTFPDVNATKSTDACTIIESSPSEQKSQTRVVSGTPTLIAHMASPPLCSATETLTEPKPKLKYSDFGFRPSRRITLNFTMDNTLSGDDLKESHVETGKQSFAGIQSVEQPYEVRVSNRLFMEKLGLERVDLDEWRWPIRRGMFNLVVKCPLAPLDECTQPSSLSYEIIPGKIDGVTLFLADKIQQSYSVRWLAVRCNTLKDLKIVLNAIRRKLTLLKPMCRALNYISLRYPCIVTTTTLQFTVVDVKSVVKFDVTVDLQNWDNISGVNVSINNTIGNVNENIVRIMFNDLEKNDSIFYSFINKLRKYRERLLI